MAHLNYIHQNPAKHGLVKRAEEYAFSSYGDFIVAEVNDLESELSHVVEY